MSEIPENFDIGLFISLFNTVLGITNKELNEKQLQKQNDSQTHLHNEIMTKLDEILKEIKKV